MHVKQLFLLFLILISCNISYGQHYSSTYLFIGTYTDGKPAKGIYVYKMNSKTGELTAVSSGENITNPSFLTISPNGKYLYACTDTKTAVSGSVSSFAIDSVSGKITFINKQSGNGANPVYVVVDKSNHFVVNANYTEGNVSVFSLNNDGSLNPFIQSIQFSDSSINKTRQDKPHIHSAIFSPAEDYVYLPDLGSDKIRAFKFNTASQQPLLSIDSLTVKTVPSSGPRHMAFHPNKKFVYCIEEMSGMVVGYSYKKGKLSVLQRIASHKEKMDEYAGADIHISPDGLFLYASNRMENTISIFSIAASGKLKLVGHEPTLGDTPRNFTLDPTGNFLLVANQVSNNIVVFKRNTKTGLLTKTGIEIGVPAPSCLKMKTYGG